MKYYSAIQTTRHSNSMGKSRNSIQSLIRKNAELEDRLADTEASSIQSESKLFEMSARTGQSELRAGRADLKATEASEKAILAEERAMLAEGRAIEAEARAMLAEERSIQAEARAMLAEERSIEAEGRAIRLEEKWMKITGVIKMPFKMIRWAVKLPRRLFRKAQNKTVFSSEPVVEPGKILSDSNLTDTASDHNDRPAPSSPRTQHIHQDLKDAIVQQKDAERCE